MLTCGDAILMPSPGVSSLHLWIIITDPSKDSGKAIIVSVTTRRAHSDLTLIIKPSDHPWIKHDSVVMYSDASIIDTSWSVHGRSIWRERQLDPSPSSLATFPKDSYLSSCRQFA
jgi:hypothetical protein